MKQNQSQKSINYKTETGLPHKSDKVIAVNS